MADGWIDGSVSELKERKKGAHARDGSFGREMTRRLAFSAARLTKKVLEKRKVSE